MELNRSYPEYARLGGEILVVSPSTVERARIYAQKLAFSYPYLCDPKAMAFEAYGLGPESTWSTIARGARALGIVTSDLAAGRFSDAAMMLDPTLLRMRQLAFFAIDKQGILRVADPRTGIHAIPGREEIVKMLKAFA